jgi:hypothetical protein
VKTETNRMATEKVLAAAEAQGAATVAAMGKKDECGGGQSA